MTDRESDHSSVGYGRPPLHTRFKKGQSGNPRGRVKNEKSWKTLLASALDEKVTVNENGESRRITKREAAAIQLANRVAMGDHAALRLMVDLLAEREEREEELATANVRSTSWDRINAKLDVMAARLRASGRLPPK